MKILDLDIGDRKLILGSSSASRRLVVESLNVPFEVLSPDIDEKAIRYSDPKQLTMAIANAKADALITKVTEPAILIASDQVVVYEGVIREKAKDADEAREFLGSYNHAPAGLTGAIVVVDTKTGKRVSGAQMSRIYFKKITDEFIEEYIKDKRAFEGAGGFGIQHDQIFALVDHLESTKESVMGLDKDLLLKLIREVLQ